MSEGDVLAGAPHPRTREHLFGHAAHEAELMADWRAGRMPHALLIGGPEGIGKATLAYRIARFVLAVGQARPDQHDFFVSQRDPVFRQVAAMSHPDLLVLRRAAESGEDKIPTVIPAEMVRKVRPFFGSTAASGGWRVCIVDAVDELNAFGANALLKTLEEPPPRALFLLVCHAPGRVLPTIRSRTRIVNLAVPSTQAVAGFLTSTTNVEPKVAQRAARLAEGHIGIAKLYATDERVMSDRDELVVGVLNLARASDAVLLAGNLIDNAKAQAEADANRITAGQEAEFRRINGLAPSDRIPPKLRGAFNQIAKKDDVKRLVTRRTRDVLDRALNSIASIYRDVAVLQNNAEDSVGLINLENRSSITELSVRLNRSGAVTRLDEVAHARKRLAGNGNPLLVFESLFCALIS